MPVPLPSVLKTSLPLSLLSFQALAEIACAGTLQLEGPHNWFWAGGMSQACTHQCSPFPPCNPAAPVTTERAEPNSQGKNNSDSAHWQIDGTRKTLLLGWVAKTFRLFVTTTLAWPILTAWYNDQVSSLSVGQSQRPGGGDLRLLMAWWTCWQTPKFHLGQRMLFKDPGPKDSRNTLDHWGNSTCPHISEGFPKLLKLS